MALLQAARAFVLGLSLGSAESWGLNRAIFYAAAKRGFKGGGGVAGSSSSKRSNSRMEERRKEYFLGDEMAYREGREDKPYFKIGNEVQTEKDFAKQVKARFQGDSYEIAWKEALDIVKKYDKSTLESGSAFFDEVYKPRRGDLKEKWTGLSELKQDKE